MTTRALARGILVLAVALLATIALLAVVWVRVNQTEVANCRQIEAVKAGARQVVKQSEDALGKRGTAGYAYFRAHPEELRAARAAGARELGDFAPHSCS